MDIKTILQDERKKKFLIIGLVIFLVIIGIIFLFTGNTTTQNNQGGQTQLLTDIAQLAPRNGVSQGTNRTVAPIITVSADTTTVAPGQPAVISWNSDNATSCVDGTGNALRLNGSLSIAPKENYTLDVVCTNPKGTTLESITIAVTTSPIITLSAYPQTVKSGEQSFISWNTTNTTRCIDGAGKTLRLNDSISIKPKKPYTFEISCTGPNGTGKNSVTIAIAPPQTTTAQTKTTTTTSSGTTQTKTTTITTTPTYTTPAKTTTATSPTITLSTNLTKLKPHETATVTWTSTNTESCVGTTSTGVEIIRSTGESLILVAGRQENLTSAGNIQIRVLAGKPSATIIISCTGPNGTTEKQLTVYADLAAPPAGPPIIDLVAEPTTVPSAGAPSFISWNTAYATSCTGGADTTADLLDDTTGTWSTIYNVKVPLELSGSAHVTPGVMDPLIPSTYTIQSTTNSESGGFNFYNTPIQTTTFTISCTGPIAPPATKSVTVNIAPPPSSCGGILNVECW